jgi:hypothetical protein
MPIALDEASLDWLLNDEVTRRLMARDGVTEASIRRLMQEVGATLNVERIDATKTSAAAR